MGFIKSSTKNLPHLILIAVLTASGIADALTFDVSSSLPKFYDPVTACNAINQNNQNYQFDHYALQQTIIDASHYGGILHCYQKIDYSGDGVWDAIIERNGGYYNSDFSCNTPSVILASSGECVSPPAKFLPDPPRCEATPHPIAFGTGNKVLRESDIIQTELDSLTFSRTYNSTSSVNTDYLGKQWRGTYSRNLNIVGNNLYAMRSGGKIYSFTKVGNVWQPDADISDKLTQQVDSNGVTTGWTYIIDATSEIESYDTNGKLVAITNRAGLSQTMRYSCSNLSLSCSVPTPSSIAQSDGLLIQVSDSFGKSIYFTYDSANRIKTMTDPSGGIVTYAYDSTTNNLTSVTYPDGKVKTYLYGEAAHVSTTSNSGVSYANALTGIIDENGKRYANYNYDASGRAYSETLAEGADATSLVYTVDGSGNPTFTVVTEPNGTARTYNFTTVLGVVKSTGQNQPAGSGCSATASNLTYDANGNVATKTDFNGYLTQYGYDTNRNLETTRTEGLNGDGTSRTEARTITTSWHPTWRLPLVETTYNGATASGTPIYKITRSYDTHGNLTQITETDPVRSRTRTTNTSYTYSSIASGLIVQKVVDGARADVNDITTYSYFDANATCAASTNYPNITNLGCRGQLQSMTDPLGHITQYNRYNPNGQLEQMTDANGTVTSYTYTPRQWIKTITVAGNTATFDYDYVGQIKTSTLADGSYLSYSYDDAHRLTDITDAAGHTIHYTLDSSGNRTKEEYRNADGSNAQEINRVYDALNRLQTEIHGSSTQAGYQYGYYANGEAKTSTTANNAASQYMVDALGRPTQLIDPVNGSTKPTATGYDTLDRITQLTTPNGSNTQYTLDGLGNILTEASSEAGNLQATYDDAGNLKTQLDARGVTATYSYDALNRLTNISTSIVGSITATSTQYTWDTASGCTHGIGRLCQVTDVAGSTIFNYDNRGNRIGEVRTEAGTSFNNIFAYNNADRRTDNISATVETVSVTRDNTGKVVSLTATSSSNLFSAIAQGIAYNANGQVSTQTLGQSTNTLSYDVAGRLATLAGTDTTTTGGTGNNNSSSNSGDVPLPPWAMVLMGLGLLTLIQRRSQLNDKRARHTKINSTNSLLLGLIFSCSLLTGLNPQSADAADLTIQYDNDGNPSSKTTPNGTSTYTYDALDRIKTESGQNGNKTHTFDGNNNRTSDGAGTTQTYTPNTDRIATYNGINVTLDAAGHITFDGTYRYVYDGLNQLSELHKADNTLLATYYYDYRGLRTRKVTTANAPQGANTFFYFYDPDYHLIAETGGATLAQAHTPQMTYIWNDNILTGIIVHQPSRTAYTVDVDHLGSPYQVRTLAGKVVWRWDSDAFGTTPPNEDVDGDGSKLTLNLRFPGQYYDQESGLYYNVKRYYSAKLARYLSPDPIGLAGGNNRFSYVGGQPTRLVDPSGEFFVVPAVYYGALGIASVGAAWWAASHQPVMSSGASSDGDFPFTESPPKRASENGCASPEKKNCEALRQSILKTCFGLTGRKRMACFEAANTAYRQCMGYE